MVVDENKVGVMGDLIRTVDSIVKENDPEYQHQMAMEIIANSQDKMAPGYVFSHYIVKGVATVNSPDPKVVKEVVAEAIDKKLEDGRLEVIALYENPKFCPDEEGASLKRSILYVNLEKKAIYLNGKEASVIDCRELLRVIHSHQK